MVDTVVQSLPTDLNYTSAPESTGGMWYQPRMPTYPDGLSGPSVMPQKVWVPDGETPPEGAIGEMQPTGSETLPDPDPREIWNSQYPYGPPQPTQFGGYRQPPQAPLAEQFWQPPQAPPQFQMSAELQALRDPFQQMLQQERSAYDTQYADQRNAYSNYQQHQAPPGSAYGKGGMRPPQYGGQFMQQPQYGGYRQQPQQQFGGKGGYQQRPQLPSYGFSNYQQPPQQSGGKGGGYQQRPQQYSSMGQYQAPNSMTEQPQQTQYGGKGGGYQQPQGAGKGGSQNRITDAYSE